LRDLDIPFDAFDVGEAARRFPQFAGIGDRSAIFEPAAGVLLARQSLLALVALFERRGGIVACGEALPVEAGGLTNLRLSDGRSLSAGAYVFACGPWLPRLFPKLWTN